MRNAAQTFQRFIDTVLRGLEYCHDYIDDVLVASKNEDEHHVHLEELFQRFRKYELSINTTKSHFGEKSVDYLGYTVNQHGICPIESRINVLLNFKKPNTVSELRKYLGIINFYHRFIKNAATLLAPLNNYLQGTVKKDKWPIAWTPEAKEAFEESKKLLAEVTLLAHPLENAKLALKTDAFNFAMGAVLEQFQEGQWKPLGFFSRKSSEAQRRYSTYDRELLAIFASLKFFRHQVEGQDVTVFTDHKPLQYASIGQSIRKAEKTAGFHKPSYYQNSLHHRKGE